MAGIPSRAPAFYFLDVSNDEKQAFLDLVKAEDHVEAVETAPMLRGRIVKVGDIPADRIEEKLPHEERVETLRSTRFDLPLPDRLFRLPAGAIVQDRHARR